MTPGMLAGLIDSLKEDDRIWIVTRFLQVYDPDRLFMTEIDREFPCLIDDSLPRIELRSRPGPDGNCPAG